MKALRVSTGTAIEPFGEAVGELLVLDDTLRMAQDTALLQAGCTLVDTAPVGPCLVYTDRTWFTADLVRALVAAGPGRLRVRNSDWLESTGSLQPFDIEPGLYEMAVVDGSLAQAGWRNAPPVDVDLGLRETKLGRIHPALQHASRPMMVGTRMVHGVDHWSHLLRVNLLALAARGEHHKAMFENASWWSRLTTVVGTIARLERLDQWGAARAISRIAPTANIHPTAVVELSEIGEGVEIGPHAVVRASILGAGSRVLEHASVNLSILGAGAEVGRYGIANLCVVFEGACVSCGGGYQMCVVGRQAFLAHGVTALDVSFGRTIRVEHRGALVDTGLHFLGVAIGHRARLGNAVRLCYGATVPNDAFLVADADDLLRVWGDASVEGPLRVVDGSPRPVGRKPSGTPPTTA